jgi:thiol-disulfide isomerase/thioredoxin
LNGSRRSGIAAALLGLALLIPTGAHAQIADGQDVGLPVGSLAQAAMVQDLQGNPVQVLDLIPKGKPAILEFWATWCELCAAIQPQMEQIQKENGGKINIVAVGVGVGQNIRRIQQFVDQHKPGYTYVFDNRGNAVRAYLAATTSIVLMLDANGKVVYQGVGADQDLLGAVKKVLAAPTD